MSARDRSEGRGRMREMGTMSRPRTMSVDGKRGYWTMQAIDWWIMDNNGGWKKGILDNAWKEGYQ